MPINPELNPSGADLNSLEEAPAPASIVRIDASDDGPMVTPVAAAPPPPEPAIMPPILSVAVTGDSADTPTPSFPQPQVLNEALFSDAPLALPAETRPPATAPFGEASLHSAGTSAITTAQETYQDRDWFREPVPSEPMWTTDGDWLLRFKYWDWHLT